MAKFGLVSRPVNGQTLNGYLFFLKLKVSRAVVETLRAYFTRWDCGFLKTSLGPTSKNIHHLAYLKKLERGIMVLNTALLKVDFGSRSQSRVPDFYSTFVKKSTLKSTLLDFKSGKSDRDSTPPRRSDPYPKP